MAVSCGTYVMMEIGSQAWLYGGLLNVTTANGEITSYPIADYKIDGVSGESLTRSTPHQSAYSASHYSRFSDAVV